MPPAAQNPVVLTFQSFAWVAGRSETGGPKATWQGPGKRDDLYGQDALRALAAQGRTGTPASRLRQQTAAVGRAAVRGGVSDAAAALGRSVRNEIGRPALHEAQELATIPGKVSAKAGRLAVSATKETWRFVRTLDKEAGPLVGAALEQIPKIADRLQAGVAKHLPRLHALVDYIARVRVPVADIALGEVPRMWHAHLNKAAAGGYRTGAGRALLNVGKDALFYYGDDYNRNRIRWGIKAAQVIEAAALVTHRFLVPMLSGAAVGSAVPGLGTVGGAVAGLAASFTVPFAGTIQDATVKKVTRLASQSLARLFLGTGRMTKESIAAQAARQKEKGGLVAVGKKKRAAAAKALAVAKKAFQKRKARERLDKRKGRVATFAEPALMTLAGLIRETRDRIGEPVPTKAILAVLLYLAGDSGAETFGEQEPFEAFAFDPANYTKTEKGTYRSKGGRVLSAAQYAAASQRFQQRAKGGGKSQTPATAPAKPPAKPPEKTPAAAASPQPSGLAAGMAKLNQQRADEAKRNGQTRLSGIYEERARQWESGERKPSSTTGAAPQAKPPVSLAVQEKVNRRIDALVQEEDAILGKFGLRTIQDEDHLRQIDAEVKRLHAAVAPKPTPAPQAKPNPPQKPKPAAAMTTGAPMLGGIPRADFLRRVDELKKGGVSGSRAAVLVSRQIREQQAAPKEPPPLGVKPMVAGLGGMAAGSAIGAAVGGPLGAGVGAVIGGPVAAYAARKLFGSPDKPIGTAKPDGSGPTWKDWVAEVGVQAIAKSAGLLTGAVTLPLAGMYGAVAGPVVGALDLAGADPDIEDAMVGVFEDLIEDPFTVHDAAKRYARRKLGGVQPMAESSVSMLDAMTTAALARLEHLAAQSGKPMPAIDPAALKRTLVKALVAAKKAMKSQTSGHRPAT